jgi:glucosyl-3-phosphoglycerate synthase
MSDFHQSGPITTLHRLDGGDFERRAQVMEMHERDLLNIHRETPIALVIPATVSDANLESASRILRELHHMPYARKIIGLDGANAEQYLRICKKVHDAKVHDATVIWNDGPNVSRIYRELQDAGLHDGAKGKGLNVWLSYAYANTTGAKIIAESDIDVITYSREGTARMLYAVGGNMADPMKPGGYEFVKAFFPRLGAGDRLCGRVTRLFLNPLVDALADMPSVQNHPRGREMMHFIGSFRYALSGEFAAKSDLLMNDDMAANWGVEIDTLCKLYTRYKNESEATPDNNFSFYTRARVAQAELCDNYEHKHQSVSPDDPSKGLHRMARDIFKALIRNLHENGIALTPDEMSLMEFIFSRHAYSHLQRHQGNAEFNRLQFDRKREEATIGVFTQSIREGIVELGERFEGDRMRAWNVVRQMMPEMDNRLVRAVEEDRNAVKTALRTWKEHGEERAIAEFTQAMTRPGTSSREGIPIMDLQNSHPHTLPLAVARDGKK